jgi:hypothetical protein
MVVNAQEIPIIDFHVHLGNVFPTKTQVDLEAQTDPPPSLMITSPDMVDPDRLFYRNRPKPFTWNYFKHGLRTLYQKRKMISGATIPNLKKSMQKNGVCQSVVLPIEYTYNRKGVSELIRMSLKHPEIIPFCSVDPKDPKARDTLRSYINIGAKGLKLHPNFQDFKPLDRMCLEIYEEASHLSLPIVFHTGTKGTEKHPDQVSSNLKNFEKVPGMFPQIPFILGHMGISQHKLAIQLARKYQNVYLETSGQPASHIREAIQVAGGDKILFGSDWPLWDLAFPLNAVFEATNGDTVLRKIVLHKNAIRILKGVRSPES